MSDHTQDKRLLVLTTPIGPDALLPLAMRGTEELSHLFNFDVDIAVPVERTVSFDQILGRAVTLALQPDGVAVRHFNGIVNRFSERGRDARFTYYRARVVPKVWLLTRTRRCRIFQHLSTPEILSHVLAGFDVTYHLTATYRKRNYCVQYQESDFDFINRLMEEDGIHYFFRHTADKHTLVLADATSTSPRLPVSEPVVLRLVTDLAAEEWYVSAWEKVQEIRSDRYVMRDHSYETPGNALEGTQTSLNGVQVGTVTHNLRAPGSEQTGIYEYPGRYAKLHDEDASSRIADRDRIVRLRMEAEESAAIHIEGTGNCQLFLPGFKFDLQSHGHEAGSYLLTRVDHDIRNGEWQTGEMEASYSNTFICIPAALPYRRACQTPRPTIAGFQTAIVTGPKGEELFCDKYGRVKVQFHWDREGKHDGESSCWLRVGQVWAGKSWGAFFWPRIGHEVIVAFENGDPDCPLIVGSVYNALNMPPFALPAAKMLGGIRSASVRGAARQNFNSVVFNDEKGSEHLSIHSERNLSMNSEYDKMVHAGRHKGERVLNSAMSSVGVFPGGGSGGGGGGMEHGNPVDIPQPINEAPGLNAIWVFGENMQAALGLNHQMAIGANQQICINPLGLASAAGLSGVEVAGPGAMGVLAGNAGNIQLTVGPNVQLTLGQSFQVNLGPKGISCDGDDKCLSHPVSFTALLTLSVAAMVYAGVYGLLVRSNDMVGCARLTLVYQELVNVLLDVIMVSESVIEWTKSAAKKLMDDPAAFAKDPDAVEHNMGAAAIEWNAGLAALVALIGTTWVADANDSREQQEQQQNAANS